MLSNIFNGHYNSTMQLTYSKLWCHASKSSGRVTIPVGDDWSGVAQNDSSVFGDLPSIQGFNNFSSLSISVLLTFVIVSFLFLQLLIWLGEKRGCCQWRRICWMEPREREGGCPALGCWLGISSFHHSWFFLYYFIIWTFHLLLSTQSFLQHCFGWMLDTSAMHSNSALWLP